MKKIIACCILSVMCIITGCDSKGDTLSEVTKEVDISVKYSEIYKEYEKNKIRADEKYKGNRYQIKAKVNGIATGGLLNFDDSINLTMEKKVGNTIVFFYAEFDKGQKEKLKAINTGDTITFEGECFSAGSWSDCKLVE